MTTSIESTSTRAHAVAAARDQLMLRRIELRDAIDRRLRVGATLRSDATDGHGETEHLAIAEQHENDARLDAIASAALADVEAALDRIEGGAYGQCASCLNEIPWERLEVLPATPVCVQCQAHHESS